MQRYKCTISYDGSEFSGFQIQPKERTVQGVLEKALKKLHKGEEIKVHASGRTDAGVHAKGQVIHFDSNLDIPLSKWKLALNSALPPDIVILQVEEAKANFHAQYDTIGKEYRYFVHISRVKDPFKRHYAHQYPYEVDLKRMEDAIRFLIGTHDFTSFCSTKTDKENKVRTIEKIDLYKEDDLLVFRFRGNGFLYNMVRIMVGTLLDVGRGYRSADSVADILVKKDRKLAGKTSSAKGLYLWEVFYED
ncbi:tRNA pseudouridine(38-40) synthase TruA [Bacillus sp. 03113]|uniref:tRNA pseudouridine(38-40) synthase TruA n=1 Tax=Bacillus sp. 03113 TaxID=2578211 RepID=UPI001143539D|nr:tRNA pseudouridine(38-40) synthase TruA [Bacillus sp. 03113]